MKKKHLSIFVFFCVFLVILPFFTTFHPASKAIGNANIYLPMLFTVRQFEANLTSTTFTNVTDIANAGDERLFIVELSGKVYVMQENGTKSLFLDLSDKVATNGSELGMFAIAFHPDYATNGYFYLTYTEVKNDSSWNFHLSQFEVSSDPNVGNKNSEANILTIVMTDEKHNGGGLEFNPVDGRLYMGVGDDDQTLIAQESNSYKGRIVQIMIDSPKEIAQLKNEPLLSLNNELAINQASAVSRYAKGFRNPWRITSDPISGTLYVGDVGDRSWEEINAIPINGQSLNYGWPCKEGSEEKLDFDICDREFVEPIYAYSEGCAITLGEIYRPPNEQQQAPEIIFADGCQKTIQSLRSQNGEWVVSQFSTLPAQPGDYLTTFGMGVDGTIYGGLLGSNVPLYEFYIPPIWDR